MGLYTSIILWNPELFTVTDVSTFFFLLCLYTIMAHTYLPIYLAYPSPVTPLQSTSQITPSPPLPHLMMESAFYQTAWCLFIKEITVWCMYTCYNKPFMHTQQHVYIHNSNTRCCNVIKLILCYLTASLDYTYARFWSKICLQHSLQAKEKFISHSCQTR